MNSVIERIKAYNDSRIKDILPLKYSALREGIFRFYRGTAHLFYEDLAAAALYKTGARTWICGDLHLENYGTYKGDNRLIYFDINDFDESVLAPVSLEILRMTTSIYVGSSELGIEQGRADVLANRFLTKYIHTIIAGKPHSFQRETTEGVISDLIQSVSKRKNKEILDKRTESHKGMLQLSIIPGKTTPASAGKAAEIKQAFISWNDSRNYGYKLIDLANRIMGTGSLGLERYILLCFDTEQDKPLLLDLKEAGKSCVLQYFDFPQPAWENDAVGVIKTQSLLQDTPPALLRDFTVAGKSYVIKELQPSQDKLDLKIVSQKNHKFEGIIEAMADIAASAHLRATGRYTAESGDELIESVKRLQQPELLAYARDYAKKVDKDYKEYASSF